MTVLNVPTSSVGRISWCMSTTHQPSLLFEIISRVVHPEYTSNVCHIFSQSSFIYELTVSIGSPPVSSSNYLPTTSESSFVIPFSTVSHPTSIVSPYVLSIHVLTHDIVQTSLLCRPSKYLSTLKVNSLRVVSHVPTSFVTWYLLLRRPPCTNLSYFSNYLIDCLFYTPSTFGQIPSPVVLYLYNF